MKDSGSSNQSNDSEESDEESEEKDENEVSSVKPDWTTFEIECDSTEWQSVRKSYSDKSCDYSNFPFA